MNSLTVTVPALCDWLFANATFVMAVTIAVLTIYTIGYVRGARIR